jgi:hypothetical protein
MKQMLIQTNHLTKQAHTAVVLRLTTHYHGSNRVIIGDSAFSSVGTCMALLQIGLHYMGIVKTCHKLYPLKYLKMWEDQLKPIKGDYITLNSSINVDSRQIFAIAWKPTKNVRFYISTCSTSLQGSPQIVQRHRVVVDDENPLLEKTIMYQRSIPAPELVNYLFDGFEKIDVHDHLRQGILRSEETSNTKTWWHRIMDTLIGVIITNSYLIMKFEYEKMGYDMNNFQCITEFAGKLAHQLIFNEFLGENVTTRGLAIKINDSSSSDENDNDQNDKYHIINALSQSDWWINKGNQSKRKKIACSQCTYSASYYCVKCSDFSDPDNPYIVPLCNPFDTPRVICWESHCEGINKKKK